MTRPFSWGGCFALLLSISAASLPFVVPGQRSFQQVRTPHISDWTTRHVVYTQFATSRALEAARNDPRAIMRWREMDQQAFARRTSRVQPRGFLQFGLRNPGRRFPERTPANIHPDWSINLGSTGTADGMYPAKYTFDPTVTPSCTNDFVVFPIAANGSTTQANIVAFNNLYSGTAGSNGFCNRTGVVLNDNKTSATVMWSYNVHAIAAGAAVPTSPSISLDGKKVAFVESATGSAAHFHVLAWRSTDTGSTNLQTTTSPKPITGFTTTIAPVATATTGVASDLPLGALTTGTDTFSSPYIDYANDLAYVGNDIGILYRIKNVFCTLPACTGVTNGLAPSLDSTWGVGGAVTVCSGSKLTGPVLDFYNLNVYAGCSDGKLYSITQAGVVTSLAVGDGTAISAVGGIIDPPIVDGANGFIYAVSGSAGNKNHGVLVQAKADFSSSVAVPIGNGNQCNLHSPAFSNTYFTNTTPAGAQVYIGGVTGNIGTCTAAGATGGAAVLYGANLGTGGVLTAGAPTNSLVSGNPVGSEYAPIGEFFNSSTGKDVLFVALFRNNSQTFNNIYSFDVTLGFTTTIADSVTEGLGTSGMVFDNAASTTTFPQASSFYFNSMRQNTTCTSPQSGNNTNGCAVKLTQTGLQ